MFQYITDLYDAVAKYEQLEEVAGPTEKARAKITKQVFEKFLISSNVKYQDLAVLEIGPASGYITNVLNESISGFPRCHLDLMDFSAGFIDNVKHKNYRVENYFCTNITDEKIDKKFHSKYDIIFFQEVLEHLINPFAALANINLMLKSGGIVFLTIPNGSYWRNLFMELFKPDALLKPGRFMDTHISEVSTIGMLKLATMTGFNASDIFYYCTQAKLLKPLRSSQVGFLLVKHEEPFQAWARLQDSIINQNPIR